MCLLYLNKTEKESKTKSILLKWRLSKWIQSIEFDSIDWLVIELLQRKEFLEKRRQGLALWELLVKQGYEEVFEVIVGVNSSTCYKGRHCCPPDPRFFKILHDYPHDAGTKGSISSKELFPEYSKWLGMALLCFCSSIQKSICYISDYLKVRPNLPQVSLPPGRAPGTQRLSDQCLVNEEFNQPWAPSEWLSEQLFIYLWDREHAASFARIVVRLKITQNISNHRTIANALQEFHPNFLTLWIIDIQISSKITKLYHEDQS